MSLINARSGAPVVSAINSATPVTSFPTGFELDPPSLYIGGAGDVTVKLAGDPTTEVTFKNLAAGAVLVAFVHEVVSATATDILALR